MFSDILVVELASVLAGPSVGMFLAELGAKVIKVENPSTGGDVTRGWKLPSEDPQTDTPSYFSCANWGKNSLALNISSSEGRDIAYSLLEKADIVIVSYKPGDAEKLGMDYEIIQKLNPGIIYASISGYGEDNPKTAYDAVLQAESGFMSINGTTESGPLKMPVALIDIIAAHHVKESVLLAFIKKLKTGEGSKVSISLYEAAINSLANQATNYLYTGKIPRASGSEHPNIAPYGETFTTKDGRKIILAIGNDKQFLALCRILGIEENNDFSTNQKRLQNREALKKVLQEKFQLFDSGQIIEKIEEKNIPAGIVKNIAEALATKEASKIILTSGAIKGISQLGSGTTEKTIPGMPPALGEHTIEILTEYLHLDQSQLIDLQERNIILSKKMNI